MEVQKILDEIEQYTGEVNPELKKYIADNIFSQYSKNDKGHGLLHIL